MQLFNEDLDTLINLVSD